MTDTSKTTRRFALIASAGLVVVLGIGGWTMRHRIASRLHGERPTVCEESPVAEKKVFTTTPADASVIAPLDHPIKAEVVAEGVTLDASTVTTASVALIRVRDRKTIDAMARADDKGHAVVLTPTRPLDPQTNYTFIVSPAVKDTAGQPVPACQIAFTTAAAGPMQLPVFEKIALPETEGLGVTCVTIGPDGRLWCAVDDGRILRFDIAADGTVSNKLEIKSLVDANGGGPRLIGGLAFDLSSTPGNPIVWVTHTSFGFINMGDWHGAVSRLSGPKLETAEPVVVNLPRSARDHIIHQPSFGPDGCLYFQSGSMTSFGAADGYWGWRAEHLFSAAVVRLDPKKLPAKLPVDVKTIEDGGGYNWKSADAPVTVYAGGMRVAYDLCWTKDGQLFAAVNGSSPGGNTPAGPNSPQLWAVPEVEHDWLFRVEPGSYSGHPNPAQGTYVLNGGNPTAGPDFAEVSGYPVGTQPEPNWKPAVFDFGTHVSPNGMLQYRGEGPLDGCVIVCRYNIGNDLLAIKLNKKGDVAGVITGVPGWDELENPLDVCQDASRGNLYVSEYGKHAVTLLRRKD